MSHDPHPHRVADDPEGTSARPGQGCTTGSCRCRSSARRGGTAVALTGGVEVGAVILLVALTVFVGAIATAFTAGIIAGIGHRPAGAIVGTLYALVAIPGFIDGRRRVAKAPIDNRGRAPRTAVPFGCLALILAPFSFGLGFPPRRYPCSATTSPANGEHAKSPLACHPHSTRWR